MEILKFTWLMTELVLKCQHQELVCDFKTYFPIMLIFKLSKIFKTLVPGSQSWDTSEEILGKWKYFKSTLSVMDKIIERLSPMQRSTINLELLEECYQLPPDKNEAITRILQISPRLFERGLGASEKAIACDLYRYYRTINKMGSRKISRI